MRRLSLLLLGVLALLGAGCVTEPAPDDTTVFGHVDRPRKAGKKAPPRMWRPVEEEPVTTES